MGATTQVNKIRKLISTDGLISFQCAQRCWSILATLAFAAFLIARFATPEDRDRPQKIMSPDSLLREDALARRCPKESEMTQKKHHGSPGSLITMRGAMGISALCLFALIQFLNFSGFCYREMRYLPEGELINIAVVLNLSKHDPKSERNKMYVSLANFFEENQNCCKLYYRNQLIAPLARVFGVYEMVVNVNYKISDTSIKYKYYDSDVLINACGRVVEKMGTAEDHGPAS
jgi:hypothetical protein